MSNSLQVRCLVCGEVLRYRRESTSPLIEHLRTNHNCIHLARLPACPECPSDRVNVYSRTKILCDTSKSCDNIYEDSRRTPLRRNGSRVTVETWMPATSKIYCPKCRTDVSPLIKRPKNKITNKALGTCCMFGCWPLCFLPLMMCAPKIINLHCPNCNTLLSSFDQKTGTIAQGNVSGSVHHQQPATTSLSTPNLRAPPSQ